MLVVLVVLCTLEVTPVCQTESLSLKQWVPALRKKMKTWTVECFLQVWRKGLKTAVFFSFTFVLVITNRESWSSHCRSVTCTGRSYPYFGPFYSCQLSCCQWIWQNKQQTNKKTATTTYFRCIYMSLEKIGLLCRLDWNLMWVLPTNGHCQQLLKSSETPAVVSDSERVVEQSETADPGGCSWVLSTSQQNNRSVEIFLSVNSLEIMLKSYCMTYNVQHAVVNPLRGTDKLTLLFQPGIFWPIAKRKWEIKNRGRRESLCRWTHDYKVLVNYFNVGGDYYCMTVTFILEEIPFPLKKTPIYNKSSFCASLAGQSSPRGILRLNIPTVTFYDLCEQQSRGALVMGLSRLAENMMGVLICKQVVLLNDGGADRSAECLSEWVGWGLTVWTPPSALSFYERVQAWYIFHSHCLCKEEPCDPLQCLTCAGPSLPAFCCLTFSCVKWGGAVPCTCLVSCLCIHLFSYRLCSVLWT